MPSSSKSLLVSSRNSSIVVVPAQLAGRVIGLITTIVLARHLTINEYGIYNLTVGSLVIFSLVTNWGLGSSLQRFIPEYVRNRQYGRLFKTFFFSEAFRALTGIIAIALALAFFEPVSEFLKIEGYKYHYFLFCIGAYALFQIEFLRITFNGFLLQKYSSLGELGYLIIRLALLILFLPTGGDLLDVFTSELFAYISVALLMWYFFLKKVYRPLRLQPKVAGTIEYRRVWRYSMLSAATIPGTFLFSHAMDYFVIAAMATTSQLGIYALGSRVSTMLISIMPQSLLQTVIRPAFYHRYYAVDDKNDELNLMFRSLVVLIAVVLLPTLVLVGIQAEQILTFVFKSKFAESTPVFLMLIAFNVFTILELPSDLVLQAIENVQVRLYAQVFAVYNIVAAIFLMSRFGFLGVAFATGSALAGKSLFWFFMAHRYTGITLPGAALLKITANTAVAAVTVLWIGGFGHSFLWGFISLASGFLAYLALSYINPCFSDREKGLINRFCKRRVFNV